MKKMKFTLTGATFNEETLLLKQFDVERMIVSNMRQVGFIPNLSFVPEVLTRTLRQGTLEYTITMEGVHIGRNNWEYEGWLKDTGLIHTTPKAKSRTS